MSETGNKKLRRRRKRHSSRIGGMSQSAFAGSSMSADVQKADKEARESELRIESDRRESKDDKS